MIYSDKSLSQKLERAEAQANASFVETHAKLQPQIAASWIDVAGTYAMFDGAQSPSTQTFGLGLFEQPTDAHFGELEAFFKERGALVHHEVSPMADASLMPMLVERGYHPIELSSVLYKEIGQSSDQTASLNSRILTRIASPDETELWARMSAQGWATEHESLGDFMFDFATVAAQSEDSFPWIAELDGKAISTGTMFIHGEVAMLAGASTIPEGRNQGAQNALLRSRLEFASKKGCNLAAMATAPGSQSQKNAQKNGFAIAYTRTKWQLS